jgi:hypothetical protein
MAGSEFQQALYRRAWLSKSGRAGMFPLTKSLKFALVFIAVGVAVGVGVAMALTPRGDQVFQRIAEDEDDNPWLDPAYLQKYESQLRIGSHYRSNLGIGEEGFFNSNAKGGKTPYSFEWKFSDGVVLTEQNVTKSFDSPGEKTVQLTVRDSSPEPQVMIQTIPIHVLPADELTKVQPTNATQH